ncbi:hypothetical protein [Cohaesibacter gelatinilyticus]|uniref:DUF4407 domain-containing protein n=1 Tax=Cohaesibacter gelatinilyticus TaxID=372072 RepID=A0A285NDB6_9HYPH|nr:hypothetical protein [Cohaesibacter gelatinilyticus]SNZ07450.1 hypothetical protein SAMN06265368_0973 [Cohaesibacter gelatinilyticus]
MNKIDPSEPNTTNPNGNVGTYCGVTVTWAQVNKALELLSSYFSRKEFEDALAQVGVAKSQVRDFIRGLSQSLTQKGVLKFDHDEKVWMKLPQSETTQSDQDGASGPETIALSNNAFATLSVCSNPFHWFSRLVTSITWLVLISFNARFGLALGGQDIYIQSMVVVFFIALDLGRAMLVASFSRFLRDGKLLIASFCCVSVLMLMPVSLISTTTLFSSSLMEAQDVNDRRERDQEIVDGYRAAYQRYQEEIAELHKAWKAECQNEKCGPKAEQIRAQKMEVIKQAEGLRQKMADDSEHFRAIGPSEVPLIARIASTLEKLKSPFNDIKIWLPLFFAICFEVLAFSTIAITTRIDKRLGSTEAA